MPAEKKIDARRDFVRRFLPWLTAAAMLIIYGLTLNHWVTSFNIGTVARLSNWLWTPEATGPVYYLVTLPFRILPATMLPVALNWFSVACGALTLGLLARSASILPHDRTEAQAARERNDFFLLTIRSAWFPVILAVALCGLQLTFWDLTTNGDSEVFDLLLFAFVVWSLLEYRLDGREGRLLLSAGVAGAGMTEGMSMTGFFPIYIVAILWIRGLSFFNLRFLSRMFWCGLAGFTLFIGLQLVITITGNDMPMTFLQSVKSSLAQQILTLRIYYHCVANAQDYFDNVLMPLFISLMPLFILSIRWKFGDSSRLGSALSNIMFHTIHAILFGVCLWLVFDPPFSPREKGFSLTLYYLIALSAGYYAGYFLLIFGKKNPRVQEAPTPVILFNLAVVAGVWLLGFLAIAGLYYKNAPLVRAMNDDTIRQYTSLVIENLPRKGAIVLSDDPHRLYLTQAALASEGRASDYLLVDAPLLSYPGYQRFLHQKSPQKWPLFIALQQTNMLSAFSLVEMLTMLNSSNELYYLHPSYGYYFENFYLEPHGLVYKLKKLPDDTLLPPSPDENLIAENNEFWRAAKTGALASVEDALAPPGTNSPETFAQKLLTRLHMPHEANINADLIGAFCSQSLNFWGVELQRTGDLTDAGAYFRMALALNLNNVVAKINLRVNDDLSAGRRTPVNPPTSDELGAFDDPFQAVTADGPFDDPAFCYVYGVVLAQQNGFFRQAAAPMERVCQLDPNFWPAREWLARIYALYRLPDRALEVLQAPLNHPQDFSMSDADHTELNLLTSAAYFQKNDLASGSRLLETEVSSNPTNDALLIKIVQIYVTRNMFSNALVVTENRLRLSPDDPNWLLTKGYLDNQLKRYDDAIAALNHVLATQKDNVTGLLGRADAYLGNGNLDAARADYGKVQQWSTNSVPAAYGLGEIAWRQHDTNEVIRNYEIYLGNAPTNTAEAQTVMGRLGELKQPAGGK